MGKQLAKAVSFLVATGSSYLLNRIWTFRSRERNVTTQATRFGMVATIALILNNGFFYFFNSPSLVGLDNLWAFLAAALSVGLWNFLANKLWTFKGH